MVLCSTDWGGCCEPQLTVAQVSTAQVKEIQEDIDNYIENNQVGAGAAGGVLELVLQMLPVLLSEKKQQVSSKEEALWCQSRA